MFDFAWSEIALVGIVALIAIGPKDLPVAMRTIAQLIKKARRMAGEFQTHLDEMMREANLNEVRETFTDLRRMDIKGKLLSAVDSDGALRKTISENPFHDRPAPPPVPVADLPETPVETLPERTIEAPPQHGATSSHGKAPAFIPPKVAAAGLGAKASAPAFVPPAAVAEASRTRRARRYA